jgi:hypothetical protein
MYEMGLYINDGLKYYFVYSDRILLNMVSTDVLSDPAITIHSHLTEHA